MTKKRKNSKGVPANPKPAAENTTEPTPKKKPSEPTTKGFDLSKVPPGVENITGNPEKIRETFAGLNPTIDAIR